MDQIEKKDLQLSADTTDVVISDIVRRIVILEQLVRAGKEIMIHRKKWDIKKIRSDEKLREE